MTGRLSHPFIPTGTSDVFATLEVTAVDVPGAARAPVNLAVVIDRSGSMSGAKIANARRAALKLIDLLGEQDRLAIVEYGTDVRTFPGVFMTDGNKGRARRYVNAIVDEGGTNTSDALWAGKAQLDTARTDFRVNRLLLLSDGQPTVGITSMAGLANIVGAIRANGTTVTALGIGADFHEDLMMRLADVGGGSYGFISDATETAALFEKDLNQAGTVVGRGVALTVRLPEGVDFVEAYGRRASQAGRTVSLALPDFSAKQSEKLVLHLRAHAATLSGALDIGAFQLDYEDVLAKGAGQVRVALSSAVTHDATLAKDKRDPGAMVAVTRAQAAMNYQKAAQALDRGDYGDANKAMEQNRVLFDEAEKTAGIGSLSTERATNERLFGLSSGAPKAAPEQRREAVKTMKRQMLKSSGYDSSVF